MILYAFLYEKYFLMEKTPTDKGGNNISGNAVSLASVAIPLKIQIQKSIRKLWYKIKLWIFMYQKINRQKLLSTGSLQYQSITYRKK